MKLFKIKIAIIASILLGPLLAPALSSAAPDCSNPQTTQDQIQCGVNTAAGNNGNSDAPKTLSNTISTVIDLLSAVVGIVAVIMIIVGGLRYVTSAGNPESAKGARNTVLYAVIGLVIVALAQLIVHFVLHNTAKSTTGG